MTRWTSSKFRPRFAVELPEHWSTEEHEDSVGFAPSDGGWMTVDISAHEMPATDAVGMLAILMRSHGLKVVDLTEIELDGRSGWRFAADVIEDMTYDGMCGETADVGDHTVVHVIGVDDRVVAIHATAPGAQYGKYVDTADRLVQSIRFVDRASE